MTSRTFRILTTTTISAASLALAACSDTATAPGAKTPQRTSAQLIVGQYGTNTVTIDPTVDNVYQTPEGHQIAMPAGSICQPVVSGYGKPVWNNSCDPATAPLTFTFTTSKNASGFSNLSVTPDVRFAPSKKVMLYFHDAAAANTPGLAIVYCNLLDGCTNEYKSDVSLKTYVDPVQGVIYRRIRHFSGYNVLFGFSDDGSSDGSMMLSRAPLPANFVKSGYITTVGFSDDDQGQNAQQ